MVEYVKTIGGKEPITRHSISYCNQAETLLPRLNSGSCDVHVGATPSKIITTLHHYIDYHGRSIIPTAIITTYRRYLLQLDAHCRLPFTERFVS